MKAKIRSLKYMKPENFRKLNELLRYYDGFDNLVEFLYNRIQRTLNNTLEISNDIMCKGQYIKFK